MSETGGLPAAVMNLIEQHGGLPGLMQQFQAGGLGGVAQSWIDGGANEPVSPAQLHEVLGGEAVSNAARDSGMSTGDLLRQLAQHLPQAIDHMTPEGQLPTEHTGGWLEMALGYLRSR